MKKQTRVTHPKEPKRLAGNDAVVPPVHRSVKFTYPTIADSLTPEAKEHGFDYARDSNPTTRELELLAAELQDRDDAIATGSGMAAIWLALLGNLEAGDRVVIFVESYRPNRVAARRFLPKLGVAFTMLIVVGCALAHTRQVGKLSVRRIADDTRACRCSIGRGMRFNIECRRQTSSHPDSAEIGMSIGKARWSESRLGGCTDSRKA